MGANVVRVLVIKLSFEMLHESCKTFIFSILYDLWKIKLAHCIVWSQFIEMIELISLWLALRRNLFAFRCGKNAHVNILIRSKIINAIKYVYCPMQPNTRHVFFCAPPSQPAPPYMQLSCRGKSLVRWLVNVSSSTDMDKHFILIVPCSVQFRDKSIHIIQSKKRAVIFVTSGFRSVHVGYFHCPLVCHVLFGFRIGHRSCWYKMNSHTIKCDPSSIDADITKERKCNSKTTQQQKNKKPR